MMSDEEIVMSDEEGQVSIVDGVRAAECAILEAAVIMMSNDERQQMIIPQCHDGDDALHSVNRNVGGNGNERVGMVTARHVVTRTVMVPPQLTTRVVPSETPLLRCFYDRISWESHHDGGPVGGKGDKQERSSQRR